MSQGDQYFLTSGSGEKIELTGDHSVGRSADCDLVISDGQPSRNHAKLSVEADGVYVDDLDSTNGTFVNGDRISGKRLLADGDEVAFDISKFAFQVQRPARDDRTVLRPTPDSEEDPNRTMLRAVPSQAELEAEIAKDAAASQASSNAPAAAEPPAADAPAAEQKAVKPGSWADPNAKNASSTQFFSPEDLAAMRGETVEEKVESDVPLLQVTSGAAAGSVIQLVTDGDKKEWSIGSDDARDIVFNDQGVSVFHTILAHEKGRWKLVDQMSTNGTFVNGAKAVSAFLNSGDKIRIGTVECTFLLPNAGKGRGKSATNTGGASSGGSKAGIGIAAFVVVLALMFGAYFFLM